MRGRTAQRIQYRGGAVAGPLTWYARAVPSGQAGTGPAAAVGAVSLIAAFREKRTPRFVDE